MLIDVGVIPFYLKVIYCQMYFYFYFVWMALEGDLYFYNIRFKPLNANFGKINICIDVNMGKSLRFYTKMESCFKSHKIKI